VGLIGLAQGVIYLLPYMIGPFAIPLQEMLGVSRAQLGQLISVYGIVMWISLVPGGWLADRFEARKLVSIALILSGFVGFSLTLLPYFSYFMVMWIVMSVLQNMLYWSAAIKFVRISTTEEEQGKAYGYSYAFNALAGTLIGFLGVWLLVIAGDDAALGLRNTIIAYSILNVLIGIAIWVFFRNIKNAKGASSEEDARPTIKEMLSVLKLKETWGISILCFCLYSLQILILSYFTQFFYDVLGMTEAQSAGIYFSIQFVAVLGPIIAGTLSDKLGTVIRVIIIATALLTAILAVILVVSQGLSIWMAIVICVVAVFLARGAYSQQFAAFDELKLDRKIAGSCIGVASIIGFAPDIFIWTLFGWILDTQGNRGYTYIFAILLGMAAIGLFAASMLGKWAKNSAKLADETT